jgi:LuxR family maltose regulon positive regulatory protein
MLGEAQEMQGLLRQAAQTHRQALQLASEQGSRPAPSAGMAYVGIAGPLYEWNDLDGAMRHAMKGIELSEQGGSVDTIEDGYINLAQVYQAQGDVDKAFEMIQGAERLAQRYNHGYWMAVADEIRARLWVRRGNIAAASRWAQERRLSAGDGPEYTREFEHIAAVRVLIARASFQASPREGEIGEALRLLARLLEAAEAARRMGSVIKILALQALAFQAQGDVGQALSVLEHALSLAEPEGYVRTFVDEGEPMARLLRCALSQGIAPNYVARLLAAFGEEVELTFLAMESLIEPLSERELEVLRLVVAGLSNPEIAQELVIAVSTVKSHINHIYGKLGVESRTQAVARAQELGLL